MKQEPAVVNSSNSAKRRQRKMVKNMLRILYCNAKLREAYTPKVCKWRVNLKNSKISSDSQLPRPSKSFKNIEKCHDTVSAVSGTKRFNIHETSSLVNSTGNNHETSHTKSIAR